MLGVIQYVIIPPTTIISHLSVFFLLYLLIVLQIGHFLILVLHKPKKKSKTLD